MPSCMLIRFARLACCATTCPKASAVDSSIFARVHGSILALLEFATGGLNMLTRGSFASEDSERNAIPFKTLALMLGFGLWCLLQPCSVGSDGGIVHHIIDNSDIKVHPDPNTKQFATGRTLPPILGRQGQGLLSYAPQLDEMFENTAALLYAMRPCQINWNHVEEFANASHSINFAITTAWDAFASTAPIGEQVMPDARLVVVYAADADPGAHYMDNLNLTVTSHKGASGHVDDLPTMLMVEKVEQTLWIMYSSLAIACGSVALTSMLLLVTLLLAPWLWAIL